MPARIRHRLATLLAAMALGCADGPTGPPAAPVVETIWDASSQAAAGAALAAPPSVRVAREDGRPIAGALVHYAVVEGGGTVDGADRTTDALGVATAGAWRLGSVVGLNRLEATVTVPGAAPLVARFEARAVAGAPARLAVVDQPAGGASADSSLPTVRVHVRDALGNRVESGTAVEVRLVLRGPAGAATLGGDTLVRSADGQATFASLRATRAGAGWRLVATAAGLAADSTVAFDVRPGAPAALVAASGTAQTGVVGALVAEPPTVRALDAHGNPVPGAAVAFAVTAGDGTVGAATALAGPDGRASAQSWRLGVVVGENAVVASTAGVPPVTFTAASGAGAPTRIAFVAYPAEAVAGVPLAPRVDVAVSDTYGNRVTAAQMAVTIALAAPSATLGGATTATTANGVASFADLALTTAGRGYRLVASAPDLPSVTGEEFAVRANAPASLEAVRGEGQSAAAGTAVAVAPAVRARDAYGNAAAGVAVAFAPSGDGAVLGAAVTTDTLGVAAVERWTLARRAGANTLTATADGAPARAIAATGVPGAPASVAVQAGDAQVAKAGTIVPVAPAALVRDAFGNAVPGATVTFTITAGGGGVHDGAAFGPEAAETTGADGVATALGWMLGGAPGTNGLAAAVAGVGTHAAFAADGTPNATIRGTVTTSDLALATAPPSALGEAPPGARATTGGPAAYRADELLVTYRPDAAGAPSPARLAARAGALEATRRVRDGLRERRTRAPAGGAAWRVLDVNPATLTARVRVDDPGALEAVADELRADPRVLRVARNGIVRRAAARQADVVPGDPAQPRQAWHYAMMELPEAWALTTGSAAVTVAVIDDGARFDHPDLAGAFTTDGFDFVSPGLLARCGGGTIDRTGDGNGYDGDPTAPAFYVSQGGCVGAAVAVDGHGLHVAGTIAARAGDGVGGTGVAWSARVRPIRVFAVDGGATEMDIAKAILYAAGFPVDTGGGSLVQATRAPIVNMSFGGYGDLPQIRDAVVAAAGAGALLVAAAGNDATAAPFYPAAYPEVLAVGAVGPDGRRASYSNGGPHLDVVAPGGDQADGGATFGVWSALWSYAANAPTWGAYDGTSMAAPHVAGVAALLLAREPSLTAAQLRARLVDHARDAGAPGRDDEHGAGLVSARASLLRGAARPRRIAARLYDTTGAAVRETLADALGAYAFGELPNGRYRVYAGEDLDADGLVGVPGRRWGAFGGTSAPAEIVVVGAGETTASFAVGTPRGAEPNDAHTDAVELPVGGWAADSLGGTDQGDHFRLRIAAAGTYTFETGALGGACGHALAANTVLEVLTSSGAPTGLRNDDVDAAARRFCSRITAALEPGTYYLLVRRQALADGVAAGRYSIRARAGG